MRGTSCGQRGQAGKGRASRRWPEKGLCIGDNLGDRQNGAMDPEMPASKLELPAAREGKVEEMHLESTDKGKERLWGVTAPSLPMCPSNLAPASRASRKGRRAGGMHRAPDPGPHCCWH